MRKKRKEVIPPAFEKQIRRKAHALTFDYQERVTIELLGAARRALLSGHDVPAVQRMIEDY